MAFARLAVAVIAVPIVLATSLAARKGLEQEQALQALGGRAALRAVTTVETTATGMNFEPMENVVIETPIHVSNDVITASWQPALRRFQRKTALHTVFAFAGRLDFTEIFDGTQAIRQGRDGFRPNTDGVMAPSRHCCGNRSDSRAGCCDGPF